MLLPPRDGIRVSAVLDVVINPEVYRLTPKMSGGAYQDIPH
jgi:hypothetical protein